MKILEIKVMKGPNYWSVNRHKLVVMLLDLEDLEQKPTNKIEGFLELCSKSLKTCLKLNENTVFEHLWRYAFLKLCLFETKENLNLSFESAGLITFEKTYFILDTLAHYITCMYLNHK